MNKTDNNPPQTPNSQSHLNSKYALLCQRLGDSVVKLENLQHQIKTIKAEIDSLNNLSLLLNPPKA